MTFLFWICLVIDLMICLLSVVGKGFRSSFTDSGINTWFVAILFGCTFGGMLLRFVLRRNLLALIAVVLPLLIMAVWYLIEKAQEANV